MARNKNNNNNKKIKPDPGDRSINFHLSTGKLFVYKSVKSIWGITSSFQSELNFIYNQSAPDSWWRDGAATYDLWSIPPEQIIWSPVTMDHLLSVCVWVEQACGCRQIRQTEVGVSLEGGGRCGLTLSRHETQLFRSGTPHETPGQLWRTSAEYGLINQRKLRGVKWAAGDWKTHREE